MGSARCVAGMTGIIRSQVLEICRNQNQLNKKGVYMRKMVWVFIGVQLLGASLLRAELDRDSVNYYQLHENEYLGRQINLRVCNARLSPAHSKHQVPNCQTVRVGVRSHGESSGAMWVVVPDSVVEAFLNRYSERHDSGKPLRGYLCKFPAGALFVYYSETPLSDEAKAWLSMPCSENEPSKPQRK